MIHRFLLSKLESLAEHLEEYIKVRIDQLKLSVAENVARLASGLIRGIVLTRILFIILLFASIAAAYLVAKWTGETYLGFLIMAAFYSLLGVIFWLLRKKLRSQILDSIVRELFKGEDPSK